MYFVVHLSSLTLKFSLKKYYIRMDDGVIIVKDRITGLFHHQIQLSDVVYFSIESLSVEEVI